MGEEGVRHVMKSLLADFDILMAVGGFNSVKDFDKSILGMCITRQELFDPKLTSLQSPIRSRIR